MGIAAERTNTAAKRRCRSLNKRGEPCAARAVTEDSLCAAHGHITNMASIGRLGGRARKPSKPLRDLLREQLEPSLIVEALRSGLRSSREADRIAAARLALIELYDAPKTEPVPDPAEDQFDPSRLTAAETKALTKLLEKARSGNGSS
jgi:hypothetical protein